jgi:hypothetical protein
MITKILTIILTMLPAQVCGTPDLVTEVELTAQGFCSAPTVHLCYVGDMPQPWSAIVCCQPDGQCRVDDATESCLRNERLACLLPMP